MAEVGDKVTISDSQYGEGIVRYLGDMEKLVGKWAGIELSEPVGKHDGKHQGKAYFTCRDKHGIFVKPNRLVVVEKSKEKPPQTILFRLSTENLAKVMCYLPISMFLNLGLVCKELRAKVDSNIIWMYFVRASFPKAEVKVDETTIWKNMYKKFHKQLLHPLSIKLSITPNEIQIGDKVKINFTLKNFSEKPLNVILGYNYSKFKSGSILRTVQTTGRRKDDKKIIEPKHTGGGLCGTFAESRITTIEEKLELSIDATVTSYQYETGLLIDDYLGYFLPLKEKENKIWAFYKSDGVYKTARTLGPAINPPEKSLTYWSGSVKSNLAIVKIVK